MVLLNAALLPIGSIFGSPLASSAGWRGQFPPAHSERHATQDLGSKCPLARCFARSSMQQKCTNPPEGTGRVPACDCPPTPLPSRQVPYSSKCTMILPRTPLCLLVVSAVVHGFLPLRDR